LNCDQLPPDEEPFFKLRDLLRSLALKFNELHLVVSTTENSQVIHHLQDARKTAANERIDRIFDGFATASLCTHHMVKLLEMLGQPSCSEPRVFFAPDAKYTSEQFEMSSEGMKGLGEEVKKIATNVEEVVRSAKAGKQAFEAGSYNCTDFYPEINPHWRALCSPLTTKSWSPTFLKISRRRRRYFKNWKHIIRSSRFTYLD
jgi:hypothetical protein